MVGQWSSVNSLGYDVLKSTPSVAIEIDAVKKVAVHGTLTDLVEKTDPGHNMYQLVDVYLSESEAKDNGRSTSDFNTILKF